MSELIGSDTGLSPGARKTLRALVGAMIPASDTYGIPGADEESIFAEILQGTSAFPAFLEESLRALADGQPGFDALPATERATIAEGFRASHPEAMGLIVTLVCQCYYRDERIMCSLGRDPRPPFPDGYQVPEGDWSLLDPVRDRGPIYREVP